MRGDDSAQLADLVPLVHPWALGVAYLLCRDAATAEDLVQDALVQAVRRPPDPLDVGTLKAWLRTVIFRLYLRHRERARREAKAVLRLGRHRTPEVLVDEPADDLVRALGTLSPKQRACVVLRYVEDLAEPEVARLLGLRHGTVKAHLAQGRARLRAALGALDGHPAEVGVPDGYPAEVGVPDGHPAAPGEDGATAGRAAPVGDHVTTPADGKAR